MKIRLVMRYDVADNNGHLVKYEYKTYIVLVNEYDPIFKGVLFKDVKNLPEIIGGEWLND
jgi:hypothetical protein